MGVSPLGHACFIPEKLAKYHLVIISNSNPRSPLEMDFIPCFYHAHNCSVHTPGLYNEDDVQRIRTNDWYVKRFLLARRRNVDEAFKMIRDTMRWRQEFGLPTMKDQDFPLEFYKVGGLFPYERDKDGNVVVYLRIRMHRKIPEMADPIKKFLMHIINKTDKEVDGNGMAIVFDCSGAGYSNMDMDFLTFLITSGNQYFPAGLKYILVYELSWLLNAFRRLAMSLIPQSFLPLIRFANKNDITNYIPIENLPDFMGGQCKRDYRHIPDGCTTVAKVAIDNGFTQADIDRILPIFEPLLEEADKAIAERKKILREEDNGTNADEENLPKTSSEVEICNHLPKTSSEVEICKSLVPIRTKNLVRPLSKLLGLFPDDILYLQYDPHLNTYQCNILLQNVSSSAVAYKIQSNNPSNYRVSPRLGVVMIGASLRCNIQLIAGREHRQRDRFLIMAVPVNGDHRMDASRFTRLWTDSEDRIHSHKLLTNISEHSNESQREAKELSEQLIGLKQRFDSLEQRQHRLCLLLNALLVVIGVLIALIFYGNSFGQHLSSLRSDLLLNIRPKDILNTDFKT